jgi:hypothetical protein
MIYSFKVVAAKDDCAEVRAECLAKETGLLSSFESDKATLVQDHQLLK